MRRRLVVAVFVVLLTGCTAVTAPEPGLAESDLDQYRELMAARYWSITELPDELRPARPRVTVLSERDLTPAYVKCMNIAGYEDYAAGPDGSFTIGERPMDERADAELIADYICSLSFEAEGQYGGFFNDAQIDYLYDYYRQSLVPCLELLGYSLVTPPSRDEFFSSLGGWHPYFAVEPEQQAAMYGEPDVPEKCPPMPAGIPDPGLAALWDRQQ